MTQDNYSPDSIGWFAQANFRKGANGGRASEDVAVQFDTEDQIRAHALGVELSGGQQ